MRVIILLLVSIRLAAAGEPNWRVYYAFSAPKLAPSYSQDEARASIEVLGSVKTPGLVPPLAGLTLMRAIERCGGFLDSADLSHVAIYKNGEGFPIKVDALAIQSGKEPDPFLFKGDVVTICPRSTFDLP
jgi:protein involved in polysaccharide export with SLBB domain